MLVVVLILAIAYPFYIDNLPTNIPVILAFPSVHDSVTILVVS